MRTLLLLLDWWTLLRELRKEGKHIPDWFEVLLQREATVAEQE